MKHPEYKKECVTCGKSTSATANYCKWCGEVLHPDNE